MSDSILIRPYTEADIADILTIANNRFGYNYMNRDELHSYIKVNNKIGLVATLNNKIVGFALAQVLSFDEAVALILSEHDWFKQQFSTTDLIGILKTVAVDLNYSNQGIGTALTKHRTEILKKSTNSIIAVSWEQEQNIPNIKILEKFELTLKRRIENYWMEDSLLKGYSCKQCGAPPCKCSALIYTSPFSRLRSK